MTDPSGATGLVPRPFRRRLLLNTASTASGNVWAVVVALVSLPLLLHGLGPAVFGTWVLVQTFSAITGWLSLVDLGVGTAATRAVAEKAALDEHEGVRRIISRAMAVFGGTGLLCAVALAIAGPLVLPTVFRTPADLRDDVKVAIVLFAGQVLLDLLTEGSEACLEGLQRVDVSRGVDAVRRTLVAAATSVVALQSGSLVAVAAASLGASAVGTVVGFAALVHLGGRLVRPARDEIAALLRYGRTVAVLRPLGVIHRTMDRMIVGAVIGPSAVTLVEIATQIQNGADAVLSATSYTVVGSASWLRARGDSDKLRDLLEVGTKYSSLATMMAVTGGILLAAPIVHLWLGHRYDDAPGLAVVALLYIAATTPMQVGSNLLLGIGRAGDILIAATAAVVVNLAASVVLVHHIGVVGVFVGTLIGTILFIPLLGRAVLKATGSSPGRFVRTSLKPLVLPNLAMAIVIVAILALPLGNLATVVLGGGLGVLAYLATAAVTLPRGELASVRESLSGRQAAE